MGIKVVWGIFLTHSLFVANVFIFGDGILREWLCYDSLLKKFLSTSSMLVTLEKSSLFYMKVWEELIDEKLFINYHSHLHLWRRVIFILDSH